jgi:LysM repeat protein
MNDDAGSPPENPVKQDSDFGVNAKITYWAFGVILFVFICLTGFPYIKGLLSAQSNSNKNVLATTSRITIPSENPSPTTPVTVANTIAPTIVSNALPSGSGNKTCSRYGYAQKWEFLTSYTIQSGDTLQSIAATQLHDPSRVNEIVQLNGTGPFVVGSTLYLPPPSIPKSSGNLEEVYGLISGKDSSYWHISFSNDSSGLGILIPSFWFNNVTGSDSYGIGDCVKVLFDNGNKVFTVSGQ